MLLFTGAAVGGIWFIWGRFTRRDVSSCLGRVNIAFLSLAFILSLVNFILEWILAGRIPLSNTGETLSFTVLAGTALTLFLMIWSLSAKGGNSGPASGLYIVGMLFWGCVSLVSWLLGENPVVTPLMPALQSPWLSIHVTLVMISYALLALTFIMALVGIGTPGRGKCVQLITVH